MPEIYSWILIVFAIRKFLASSQSKTGFARLYDDSITQDDRKAAIWHLMFFYLDLRRIKMIAFHLKHAWGDKELKLSKINTRGLWTALSLFCICIKSVRVSRCPCQPMSVSYLAWVLMKNTIHDEEIQKNQRQVWIRPSLTPSESVNPSQV